MLRLVGALETSALLCRCIERRRQSFSRSDGCWQYIKPIQHVDEISGCARAKPIGTEIFISKTVEQTVWIKYVRRNLGEMVAIVIILELGYGCLSC